MRVFLKAANKTWYRVQEREDGDVWVDGGVFWVRPAASVCSSVAARSLVWQGASSKRELRS